MGRKPTREINLRGREGRKGEGERNRERDWRWKILGRLVNNTNGWLPTTIYHPSMVP